MRHVENADEATHRMSVYDIRGSAPHIADFYVVLSEENCYSDAVTYLQRNFPSQVNEFSAFQLSKIKAGACQNV